MYVRGQGRRFAVQSVLNGFRIVLQLVFFYHEIAGMCCMRSVKPFGVLLEDSEKPKLVYVFVHITFWQWFLEYIFPKLCLETTCCSGES